MFSWIYICVCRTTLSCLTWSLVVDWLWRESWKRLHISHYQMRVSQHTCYVMVTVYIKAHLNLYIDIHVIYYGKGVINS